MKALSLMLCASLSVFAACQHDSLPAAPAGPEPVASITLSAPGAILSMGATQPLVPDYRDAANNQLLGVTGASWSSSN